MIELNPVMFTAGTVIPAHIGARRSHLLPGDGTTLNAPQTLGAMNQREDNNLIIQ